MPTLTVGVSHTLSQDEATERLKEEFKGAKDRYGKQVSNLEGEWDGHAMNFRFATFGMKIAGTVTSESSQVRVDAKLPLAAMIFRSTIERQIRDELGKLLA